MSTEAVIAELLASKEPLRILVLGSEGDIKRLAALGLPFHAASGERKAGR